MSVDDALKQFDPLADVQLLLVAPAINRQPFHKFHHEVWPTLFSHTRIEKLGEYVVVACVLHLPNGIRVFVLWIIAHILGLGPI